MKQNIILGFVALLSCLLLVACGDDTDAPATSEGMLSQSIQVEDCLDACDKVVACWEGEYNVDMGDYLAECEQACDQSGNFHEETIICIFESSCGMIRAGECSLEREDQTY